MHDLTVDSRTGTYKAFKRREARMIQWGDKPLLPYRASAIVSDLAAFACLVLLILILLAIPWVASE